MCKAHSKVTHIKQQIYFHHLKRPEARCIKERSSDLRHNCGALLNATTAPTGALQVFLDHKKTSHPWTQSRDIMT